MYQIVSYDLAKEMNPVTYAYFVFDRRYGHLYVEVTGKKSKNCKG